MVFSDILELCIETDAWENGVATEEIDINRAKIHMGKKDLLPPSTI